nr:MAG TPA: hypothetical protein [Caudoviricetes sp.]
MKINILSNLISEWKLSGAETIISNSSTKSYTVICE